MDCLRPNYSIAPPISRKQDYILLSRALAPKARLSFPHNQSLPSGSIHKPFIFIYQKADKSIKNQNPHFQNKYHNHRKLTKRITQIKVLCERN